jgi:hypothetical protein
VICERAPRSVFAVLISIWFRFRQDVEPRRQKVMALLFEHPRLKDAKDGMSSAKVNRIARFSRDAAKERKIRG